MSWEDELGRYGEYLRAKGTTEHYLKTAWSYLSALGEAYHPVSYLDLTQQEIIGWFAHLREEGLTGGKGLSEMSLKTVAGRVRSLFRWLNGGTTPASLRGMTIGKTRTRVRSKEELITPEEMERFLRPLDAQKKAIFRILWTTGARPSEVLHLRREDAVLKAHNGTEYAELAFRDTKTGDPRIIPLADPKALRALKDYLEIAPSEGYLFPSPVKKGEPLGHEALWKFMKRTGERLGIKKRLYPYLLRHSRATQLATAPRAIADRLMGWKSGLMWKNYTHLATDDLRDFILGTEEESVSVGIEEARELLDRLVLQVASDPELAGKLRDALAGR